MIHLIVLCFIAMKQWRHAPLHEAIDQDGGLMKFLPSLAFNQDIPDLCLPSS
jgi:hypothetical protein